MRFDLVFRKPALRFYMDASPDEQDRLDVCFEHLRVDPYVDLRTKYKLSIGPTTLNAIQDGGFNISYRFSSNTTVQILQIRHAVIAPPPGDPSWRL